MFGKKPDEAGPNYEPEIIALETLRYFHWRAYMMTAAIFTNDKIFELEETSVGTKLIHKETFRGLLAPVFGAKMQEGVPPMLNAMNAALKELAEK